jgi:hypothetical protein
MRNVLRLLQCVVLITLTLGAAPALSGENTKENVLVCRAADVITAGMGLQNRTFSILSLGNLNEHGDLVVQRIVVYGYDGQVLCDFPSLNAYPVGFKSTLGPHEMSNLLMNNLSCLMPTAVSPAGTLLVYVYWAVVDRPARIPMEGVTVQTVVDPANFRTLARDHFKCTAPHD